MPTRVILAVLVVVCVLGATISVAQYTLVDQREHATTAGRAGFGHVATVLHGIVHNLASVIHGQAHHAGAHDHLASEAISVESVIRDSPAAAAGLQSGDAFVRLDGRPIATMDDLYEVLAKHEPGDQVELAVRRDEEIVELPLTFGERADGGVSIGVRLMVNAGDEPTEGTSKCLAWIDETYRISSAIRDPGLDLAEDYETLRACVEHDTQRLPSANAVLYCDNVFKVHCSGVDILAEIGEAQVQHCAALVGDSLGLKLDQHKSWKTCAQHRVFDAYAKTGASIDADACRSAFLDCEREADASR